MDNQNRRIEDKRAEGELEWDDQARLQAVRAHALARIRLANAFAEAGRSLLNHVGTGYSLAAIPDTEPRQYAIASTLPMIAQVLPKDEGAPAEPIAGRTVSVDVSTNEENAGDRIFAELTGETGSDGTTLIAVETERNFAAPVRDAAAPSDWINDVVRDVAELPDRDSPADQPNMMLVNADELHDIIARHASSAGAAAKTDHAPMEYRTCCDHPDCTTCAGRGGFYRLSASAAGAGSEQAAIELARADCSPVPVSSQELAAFHRFCDCCEDSDAGGHDVPKAMMSQLVRIGLVRPAGPGRHETTKFGDWMRDVAGAHPVQDGEKDAALLYTCIGKGGEYELIGTAKGAGTVSKLDDMRVYRGGNGRLYYRTCDDFDARMQRLDRAAMAAAQKGGA